MTRIKLCGLTRPCDIEWVNTLLPDYIGFVFARKSRRYIAPLNAKALREKLDPPSSTAARMRRISSHSES